MNTATGTMQHIRTFVVEELCDGEAPDGLSADTMLIEEEILDSLGIFEIISWVEERWETQLPAELIVVDNFRTLQAIETMVNEHVA